MAKVVKPFFDSLDSYKFYNVGDEFKGDEKRKELLGFFEEETTEEKPVEKKPEKKKAKAKK